VWLKIVKPASWPAFNPNALLAVPAFKQDDRDRAGGEQADHAGLRT